MTMPNDRQDESLSLSLCLSSDVLAFARALRGPPPRNIEILYFLELAPDFFRLPWRFFRDTYLLFQPAVTVICVCQTGFFTSLGITARVAALYLA